jgi:hypothetical protein
VLLRADGKPGSFFVYFTEAGRDRDFKLVAMCVVTVSLAVWHQRISRMEWRPATLPVPQLHCTSWTTIFRSVLPISPFHSRATCLTRSFRQYSLPEEAESFGSIEELVEHYRAQGLKSGLQLQSPITFPEVGARLCEWALRLTRSCQQYPRVTFNPRSLLFPDVYSAYAQRDMLTRVVSKGQKLRDQLGSKVRFVLRSCDCRAQAHSGLVLQSNKTPEEADLFDVLEFLINETMERVEISKAVIADLESTSRQISKAIETRCSCAVNATLAGDSGAEKFENRTVLEQAVESLETLHKVHCCERGIPFGQETHKNEQIEEKSMGTMTRSESVSSLVDLGSTLVLSKRRRLHAQCSFCAESSV